ncbi:hypothetical protein ACQJBY_050304 [Aegilops geniculata]
MDVDATPALKRKDAPEVWLDDDVGPGFPVASRATKIRRLVRAYQPDLLAVLPFSDLLSGGGACVWFWVCAGPGHDAGRAATATGGAAAGGGFRGGGGGADVRRRGGGAGGHGDGDAAAGERGAGDRLVPARRRRAQAAARPAPAGRPSPRQPRVDPSAQRHDAARGEQPPRAVRGARRSRDLQPGDGPLGAAPRPGGVHGRGDDGGRGRRGRVHGGGAGQGRPAAPDAPLATAAAAAALHGAAAADRGGVVIVKRRCSVRRKENP